MKHTEGPWTVDEEGWEDEGLCIYGGGVPMSSGEHAVAFVVNYGGTVEAAEANARLIVAAPLMHKLYELVFRYWMTENRPTDKEMYEAIADMHQYFETTSKAEGTQED